MNQFVQFIILAAEEKERAEKWYDLGTTPLSSCFKTDDSKSNMYFSTLFKKTRGNHLFSKKTRFALNLRVISLGKKTTVKQLFSSNFQWGKLPFKKNQFSQLCCFLNQSTYSMWNWIVVFHPMLFTGPNEPIGYINQHHT